MKKIIGLYIIYLLLIWNYFLFLYPLEAYSDSNYAVLSHAMFFSTLPLEAIFLYGVIKTKRSEKWAAVVERYTHNECLKSLGYSILLILSYAIIRLPFQLAGYYLSRREGISHQPFSDWLNELSLNTLFMWLMIAAVIWLARIVMGRFKQAWWLLLWVMALPIVIFTLYVQPIWIDPLYEDFTIMEKDPIRSAVEETTKEHGLANAEVLVVNKSEKTTTFNAYVTGIFDRARIVLWDTTLQGMERNEMLFILSHEIGHYVNHHVYIGIAGYVILSFFLLYVTAVIYHRFWGKKKPYRRMNDLRAMPIMLLTFSILLTLAQPLSLYVSRQIEKSADNYAVEHTEELEPAISSFQKMALQSKSDVDPVWWIRWLRNSHPSTEKRIERVEERILQRNDNTN